MPSLREQLRKFKKAAIVAYLLLIALAGGLFLLDQLAYSVLGSAGLATIMDPLHGLFLISLPLSWVVLFGFLLFLLLRRTRALGLYWASICVVYNAAFFPLLFFGLNAKEHAFERLAVRSTPLVKAIVAYEDEHASPPMELSELVPRYLDTVPSTGIGAYPEYLYYTGEEARALSGCMWALEVPAFTFLGWDRFLYFPSGDYPERGWGGWIERVGDWAYVHE